MAVNLTNADSALKTYYLDAVTEQLNLNANPFLASIRQNSEDVLGKEVRKLAIHGVNGGIGAGTEDGSLPSANGNNYAQLVTTLKNLYGVIEVSDKAVRASENNAGAFVNLLNAEMEGLLTASKFNLGRMLYGDGTGAVGKLVSYESGVATMDNVKNLMEGMVIDVYSSTGVKTDNVGIRISYVDRVNKKVYAKLMKQ